MLTINDERQKGTMRDNDLKMQLSNDGTKALPPSPIHCSHLFLSARPSVRPIHPTVNEEPTTLLPKLQRTLLPKTTTDATSKNELEPKRHSFLSINMMRQIGRAHV